MSSLSFEVGDSVVVKPGTVDPSFGLDMGGWQGRVLGTWPGKGDTIMVDIQWDSFTLQNLPARMIEAYEEEGLGWEEMVLEAHEVELTQPRDTPDDVEETHAEISGRYAWSYLGEQGQRIRKVLAGVGFDAELAGMYAWEEHLENNLTFPFEAEVYEYQERSPLQTGDRVRVTGIGMVDDLYGVIVDLRVGRRKYAFPLCDLDVIDKQSPNHQIVADYRVWFANR